MISKGNHVTFARFVWLAVGEEAKQRPGLQVNVYCRDIFFFRFIRFGLVISRIIKLSFRVISLSRRLHASLWLAVGEEAKQRPGLQMNVYCRDISFFVQCKLIIKQLLHSVFVMSRIIKVSVRVISRSLRLRLITLTSAEAEAEADNSLLN